LPFDQGFPVAEAGTSALILGARALVKHPSLPEALTYVTGFRPDYDALAAAGAEVHATLPAGTTWQVALVCLPRNRVQGMSWIAQALRVLAPGGWLLIDGQKTDGIEAALKASCPRRMARSPGSGAPTTCLRRWRPGSPPPHCAPCPTATRPRRACSAPMALIRPRHG
jgi:16S rRNA (guanine1207-N2)-methyltransferase